MVEGDSLLDVNGCVSEVDKPFIGLLSQERIEGFSLHIPGLGTPCDVSYFPHHAWTEIMS